ncbi:MAG: hypothetical protein KC766_08620 [Myxococcales bacterium]|nr:hypothetical protein [Myxococcales bacterium]
MSQGQEPAEQPDPGQPERKLPPPRSVQAGASLWWWFLVLLAIIGVWVIAMLFMRGPLTPSDDDDVILLNPSSEPSSTP